MIYFLFSKTMRVRLVTFFVLKYIENTENTKLRKQEQFSNNSKIVLFVFSKTVIMNHFKKQALFLSFLKTNFYSEKQGKHKKHVYL